MINELCAAAHENAKEKGFYESEPSVIERLALIHSEVSEALEADRQSEYAMLSQITLRGLADKNYGASFCDDGVFKEYFEPEVKNTFQDELADICIRVFDLAGHLGIDLEAHIKAKMRYNAMRPHKHGKKY